MVNSSRGFTIILSLLCPNPEISMRMPMYASKPKATMVIILDIAGDKGACQPAKHRHERLKDSKMQRDPQAGAAVSAQRGGAYRQGDSKRDPWLSRLR